MHQALYFFAFLHLWCAIQLEASFYLPTYIYKVCNTGEQMGNMKPALIHESAIMLLDSMAHSICLGIFYFQWYLSILPTLI